jgi:hypothetical protein
MRTLVSIAIGLAATTGACSRDVSDSQAGAAGPAASVSKVNEPAHFPVNTSELELLVNMEPFDMMTSTAESVPTVSVFAPRPAIALEALSSRVHLITWPEQVEVDVDKIRVPAEDDRRPSTLHLKPKTKLSDRWYALRVDPLPKPLHHPTYARAKKLADGSAISRFRPGSQPLVAWVELCEKAGKQTGALIFSERIDPGASPETLLTLDKADCRFLPRPVTGVLDKSVDMTTNALRFTCDTPGDLKVTLKSGATAAATKSLVPETSVTLQKAGMEPVGDNCMRLVPAG